MKNLYQNIIEKLVITSKSKPKVHISTFDEFANYYKFTLIKEDSKPPLIYYYHCDTRELFLKIYNKLKVTCDDIKNNPDKYEKDIDLDTNKYCIKCTINNDSFRLKICDAKLRELTNPQSLIKIYMFNDEDNEMGCRFSSEIKTNIKAMEYLEQKMIQLMSNIVNSVV